MIKILVIYPTAFWRNLGLSGLAQGDSKTLQLIADSSPPSGCPGVLATFVSGARAKEFSSLDEDSRQKLIISELCKYFGREFDSPLHIIEKNWNDEPLTGGAFTTFMMPGGWTKTCLNHRENLPRVFWAGTEMADKWAGYFEGAVRAGESAASAALKIL